MNINGTKVFDALYQHDLLTKQVKDEDGVERTLAKYRQIVLYGGSRSSKTVSLMQLMHIKMHQTKRLRITVWRSEKVTCRSTIMKDWIDIVLYSSPDIYNLYTENKAKGEFTHKLTGSTITFEGTDSIGKVLGMKQDISIFNEITEFSRAVYLQVVQRTSQRVYVDYNPRRRFWHESYKNASNTVYLHSHYRDNAFCPEEIRLQLESYEPWETGSYSVVNGVAIYNGKPIDKINQPPPNIKNVMEKTADEYMWLVFGLGLEAEKPNKIFRGWQIIEDALYHDLPYDKYYGLDFGHSNPTAMIEVKYDGDRTIYLHERIYKPQNSMEGSLSDEILSVPGFDADKATIVCDSAKRTYVQALRDSGFLAEFAKKGAGSVSLGITILQAFTVYYTRSSIHIDEEQAVYSFKTDRYDLATDEPEKKDDHAMDAIRYVVHWLYFYLGITLKI